MSKAMPEYKILSDDTSIIQKLLNQWKHEFDLHIISVVHTTASTIIMVLTRTKR